MSIKYTFSIANSTLNGIVDSTSLTEEIYSSVVVTALDYINKQGDNCDIWFKTILSSPEHTTLSGIVASHSGEPFPEVEYCRFVLIILYGSKRLSFSIPDPKIVCSKSN